VFDACGNRAVHFFVSFMNKKTIALFGLLLLLAAIYVVGFTDWFRPRTIHIAFARRPVRFHAPGRAPADLLMFGLGKDYQLTEIKVVPLAAWQTNQLVLPVWHLVGHPRSRPINYFIYGQRIEGLVPAVKGARPQPLQPGVTYRLFVTAGPVKGWRDFQSQGAPAGRAAPR